MIKQKTVYICQSCASQAAYWAGQCPNCGAWNTLVETQAIKKQSGSGAKGSRVSAASTVKLSQVTTEQTKRVSSNIEEFDRVLGGGFVKGQVILLAGTPGVGKSTLLTQIAKDLPEQTIYYVCGEESISQIKLRADRLKYKADNLLMLAETNIDIVVETIDSSDSVPGLIIIDSVQTLYSEDFTGMPGSVGQVRGATQKIIELVKRLAVPTIIVGHVTKEGTVAGPKVLEHMVDTVLYLEGDSQHLFRILKTTKNRFGPVSEIGIFEMADTGMREIKNPSELFLNSDETNPSGVCTTVVMEGYRPLMFEIQALTVKTAFGYPRRTASGYSINRLNVLIATLEKRCGLNLSNHDVYISISGGYKVTEYSCDLAVCLAMASSIKDKPLKQYTAAFGECDLSGGIRRVPHQDSRKKEAKKLGYKNAISPDDAKTINQAIKLAISTDKL